MTNNCHATPADLDDDNSDYVNQGSVTKETLSLGKSIGLNQVIKVKFPSLKDYQGHVSSVSPFAECITIFKT